MTIDYGVISAALSALMDSSTLQFVLSLLSLTALGAVFDTTAATNALRVYYLDGLREQVNNSCVLYHQIRKTEGTTVDGKNFTFHLHTGGNESAGLGLAEGGTYRTAGVQSYAAPIVPIKQLYGHIELSGKAIYSTKTSRGSVVDALDSEMEGCTRNFKRAVSRQMNSDGTDALAFWTTADDTSGTLVDDGQNNAFVHFVAPSITADLVDGGDNSTIHGADLVVTLGAEGAASYAVTWTGTVTGSADGDYLIHANTLGEQIMGIRGIISAANPPLGALQGLDPATSPYWAAQVVTATGTTATGTKADVSVGLLQKPITRIAAQSDFDRRDISFMYSNMYVQDKYAELCAELKRMPNEMELDGGWTGLSFNNIAWITDPQCQRNVIYYIVKDALEILQLADLMWQEKDGAILHRRETTDQYIATAFSYFNLATSYRNALGKLQWLAD